MAVESLFRPEVVEKRHARLLGNVLISRPTWVKTAVGVSMLILGVLAILLIRVPIAVTETVSGYVTPAKGTARVFPQSPGVLTRLLVKEGERVEAGADLAQISGLRYLEGSADVDAEILAKLEVESATIGAQIDSAEAFWNNEQERLEAQVQRLPQDLATLRKRFDASRDIRTLRSDQLDNLESLAAKGHVPYFQREQAQISVLQSDQEVAEAADVLNRMEKELAEARSQLSGLPSRRSQAIAVLEQQQAALMQRKAEIEGRRGYLMKAPIAGRVTATSASPGDRVNPNSALITIIPDSDDFNAVLMVPPRSIGLIKPGQPVRVRYDAFPYQRFGTFSASVISVSRSLSVAGDLPIPVPDNGPFFIVVAKLEKAQVRAYDTGYRLRSGISLQADIIRDRRSILEWIFDPLYVIGRFGSK